jgi:uncharacterized damage-inducible protein DinB
VATPDPFQTLARYNRWMNERLCAACAALSDAERKRDRDAFFHSIHGTLSLVAHFFDHQTHHRCQLTTLLSQCGVGPGVTDRLWLPGAEQTSARG